MFHLLNNVENNKKNNKQFSVSSKSLSSPNVSNKISSPLESSKSSSKVLLKSNTTIITTTLTTTNTSPTSTSPIKATTKSQYYHQLSSDVRHSINIVIDRLHYIYNKTLLYQTQRLYHTWKRNIILIKQNEEIELLHTSYQTQIRNEREYYIKELLRKDKEYKDNEAFLKEYHKLQLYVQADIPKARIFLKTLERIYKYHDKRRAWNKLIVANLRYSEPVLVAAGHAVVNENNLDSTCDNEDDGLTRFEQLQKRIDLLSKHPIERIRSIRSLKRIIERMKTAIVSINRRTQWHNLLNFFHIWRYKVNNIINMEKIENLKLELRVKDNILSKFEDDVRQEMLRVTPIVEQREKNRQRFTNSESVDIPSIIKDPLSIHKEKANDITKIVFENLRLYSAKKLFINSIDES